MSAGTKRMLLQTEPPAIDALQAPSPTSYLERLAIRAPTCEGARLVVTLLALGAGAFCRRALVHILTPAGRLRVRVRAFATFPDVARCAGVATRGTTVSAAGGRIAAVVALLAARPTGTVEAVLAHLAGLALGALVNVLARSRFALTAVAGAACSTVGRIAPAAAFAALAARVA